MPRPVTHFRPREVIKALRMQTQASLLFDQRAGNDKRRQLFDETVFSSCDRRTRCM